MVYRTPLIIKEVLGQEAYDMCEKLRDLPYEPQHMIMSPAMYEAFNNAIKEEFNKQFKTNKDEFKKNVNANKGEPVLLPQKRNVGTPTRGHRTQVFRRNRQL
jgi:long-subunit acyl-CoA synthetase (AMP-forming)